MLDFRPKSSRTPNYFGRGEQRKLLLLVLIAGLVMFLAEEAANPQRWRWLWFAAGQAAPPANPAAHPDRLAKVEQPAALRRRTAHLDEFIAESNHKEATPARKRFFPGVQSDLLAEIRDDTVFRGSESDAFYHLLKILDETDERELVKASLGEVSFTQLFTQPKEFRGDLVTIRGAVRRALLKQAPKNSYGIKEYTQVVLEPDDRAYPVVVYSLELPQGFPRGEKLNEPVVITGFFYKRWAGMSGEGIATWPLLLAKTLHWQPRVLADAPAEDGWADVKSLAAGVLLAVAVSVAVVASVFGRSRGKTRFVVPQARPGEFDRLRDEDLAPDVRQQLAELARRERP